MMRDREALAQEFVVSSGWGDAVRKVVAGDASNRRYDRLTRPDGTTTILMDAPVDKGEDVRPFVNIAKHLRDIGLSAPNILTQDPKNGFLLLEDLGDDLFARVLTTDPAKEIELYTAATDVLVHLHASPRPTLAPYDTQTMTQMAALAYDWYLFGAAGQKHDAKRDLFADAFSSLLEPLSQAKQVLIQRDFHAENLLWLPDREGVSRVGLLDFQDAMSGHPAYDLVSILQDARRDVPAQIEAHMIDHYTSATSFDDATFHSAYAMLGVQRNLRILGVFARLCMLNGKSHYVDLIPRVWDHILTSLRSPALAPVADMILHDLPAPTPSILTELKSKCATVPRPS